MHLFTSLIKTYMSLYIERGGYEVLESNPVNRLMTYNNEVKVFVIHPVMINRFSFQ